MSKENWVPFIFDSNQSWGECNTKEQWEEVKKNYLDAPWNQDCLDLSKAMSCKGESLISFGFRSEHTDEYSLAQFAIDNNMTL